jgi:hypothetical protein
MALYLLVNLSLWAPLRLLVVYRHNNVRKCRLWLKDSEKVSDIRWLVSIGLYGVLGRRYPCYKLKWHVGYLDIRRRSWPVMEAV